MLVSFHRDIQDSDRNFAVILQRLASVDSQVGLLLKQRCFRDRISLFFAFCFDGISGRAVMLLSGRSKLRVVENKPGVFSISLACFALFVVEFMSGLYLCFLLESLPIEAHIIQ